MTHTWVSLADTPILNIKLGLKVLGANGVEGEVLDLFHKLEWDEDNIIDIFWENGKYSRAYQRDCKKVLVL